MRVEWMTVWPHRDGHDFQHHIIYSPQSSRLFLSEWGAEKITFWITNRMLFFKLLMHECRMYLSPYISQVVDVENCYILWHHWMKQQNGNKWSKYRYLRKKRVIMENLNSKGNWKTNTSPPLREAVFFLIKTIRLMRHIVFVIVSGNVETSILTLAINLASLLPLDTLLNKRFLIVQPVLWLFSWYIRSISNWKSG